MIKKIYNNKKLLAFILSTLLGILIVLPNIIVGKGIYYLIADINLQQIPFNMINNYLIKKGNFNFTWFNDFGSSFIPTYSFYNLFSPFNFIGYLFPYKIYPYLIGPIFILKYGLTGLTSFLFLKRYVKNKDYAVLGSILYTFSGFQFVNILFYHFHDAVCFFPLLLYTLDNLVYENKRGRFLLVVFLCSITNWFFFIEEIIFLVIYYIIKVITGEYKFTIKSFLYILLEGLLGTLMSMFILIPTYLFTSGNTRLNSDWNIRGALIYPNIWYLEFARAFVLPSQVMSYGRRAMLMYSNYSSLDLYLPLLGFIFVLSYGFHNLKKSSTIIIFISIIMMFVPIFNSTYVLFNTSTYFRWAFMPILIMSLMSVKCIENKHSIKLSSILISLTIIAFLICIVIKRSTLINLPKYVIFMILVAVINIIICNYIYNKKSKKRLKYFLIFVSLFIIFYGNFVVFQYKHSSMEDDYKNYLKYNEKFKDISDGRSNSSVSCRANLSNTKHIHNIRSFNSNIFGSTFEFINSVVAESRDVYTQIPIENKELNDFLGVKYVIGCNDDVPSLYGYEYYENIDDYRIYINTDYKEFGSSYNDFISTEEYYSLGKEDRIKALNNKIVLNNDQIKKYSYLYPNDAKYEKNDFRFLDNGFSSTIVSDKETIVVYQIPYDSGWKATINGKKAKIEKVDVGFIGVKINKGKNEIEFEYVTPGLRFGIIVSIISTILSFVYIIFVRKCKE